jgi:beta-N-acetylhexosaminidase
VIIRIAALVCAASVAWAHAQERTLERLSLEQKAAQVQMLSLDDEALVRELGAGAVLLGRRTGGEPAALIARLQRGAAVPLLVAADFDWADPPHAPPGVTRLPSFMAIGAAGSEALAERAGRYAALEGRALGLHMMLAPVLDVNTNPDNPIINTRAFGDDAAAVARLGAAYIRGARSAGVLAAAKHFPGHGALAADSHREPVTLARERAALERVELVPFRAAIAAGVDAIMVGHLAAPALDPGGAPATLSKLMIAGVLRGELGFRGLVLTDSMTMRAVAGAFEPGEAAVRALEAGADMVLTSPDPRRAAAAIAAAVRAGRLPQSRLDAAVLQVLRAKAVIAAPGPPTPASDFAAMQELAERSITLVRDERGVLPLARGRPLLHITLSPAPGAPSAPVVDELRRRTPGVQTALVDAQTGHEAREQIIADAQKAGAVVLSIFLPITAERSSPELPEELAGLVRRLAASAAPVVVVSYGSPYLLRQFPGAPAYVCAYGSSGLSQRAAVKALYGEIPLRGRLPVTLPGLYPRGHGLGVDPRQEPAPRRP